MTEKNIIKVLCSYVDRLEKDSAFEEILSDIYDDKPIDYSIYRVGSGYNGELKILFEVAEKSSAMSREVVQIVAALTGNNFVSNKELKDMANVLFKKKYRKYRLELKQMLEDTENYDDVLNEFNMLGQYPSSVIWG